MDSWKTILNKTYERISTFTQIVSIFFITRAPYTTYCFVGKSCSFFPIIDQIEFIPISKWISMFFRCQTDHESCCDGNWFQLDRSFQILIKNTRVRMYYLRCASHLHCFWKSLIDFITIVVKVKHLVLLVFFQNCWNARIKTPQEVYTSKSAHPKSIKTYRNKTQIHFDISYRCGKVKRLFCMAELCETSIFRG